MRLGVQVAEPAPPGQPEAEGGPCPQCGTPRAARFCEQCGYDFEGGTTPGPAPTPAPAPTPQGWMLVATADRDYYELVRAQDDAAAAAVPFPAYCPERRFSLDAERVHIGRRSRSRGITVEIDLSGAPEDTGVSRLHALLVVQPGGGWAVVDPGSTNGTTVNGGAEPIARDTPVPLNDGDRIHVGAWTTLTLVRHGP